jgi:hypothetical protein
MNNERAPINRSTVMSRTNNTLTVGTTNCDYTSPVTAMAAASAGDTVFIYDGTYDLGSATLTAKAGVNLVGADPDKCTITTDSAALGVNGYCLKLANNCTVSHLNIINTGHGSAILADSTISDIEIKRSKLYCIDWGVYLKDATKTYTNINVHDNDIESNNAFFYEGCVKQYQITNNHIHWRGAPSGQCFAPFDLYSTPASIGGLVTGNYGTIEQTEEVVDTIPGAYWLHLGGMGHTVAGNRIRVRVIGAISTDSLIGLYDFAKGAEPNVLPNILSGNQWVFESYDNVAITTLAAYKDGLTLGTDFAPVILAQNQHTIITAAAVATFSRCEFIAGAGSTKITVQDGGLGGLEAESDLILNGYTVVTSTGRIVA